MRPAGSKIYFVAMISLLGTMSDARAQERLRLPPWLHLDPLVWEATTEFDSSWQQSVKPGQSSREWEVESGLRFKQRGYVLDRRVATFALEIEPVTTKGRFTAATQTDDRDGDFLNFSGDVSLLHGTPGPVSVNAHASRSSGTSEGSLGSRTEFTNTNRGIAAHWKRQVFPSTLSYDERLKEDTFKSGFSAATSQRDDILRTLKFHGRSSKMDMTLERAWFDDRVKARDRDYTDSRARVFHRFRWGKGSRLNSRLNYFDREGFNPNRRFNLDENAYIQHTKTLSSTSSYRFSSTEQTVSTTTHDADLAVTHKLYDNLTTTFGVGGALTDSDFSDTVEYDTSLDFGYRKRIFWDGIFSAGVGAGYGITDRTSQEGQLDVIDESQVVPATLVVILSKRFIDISTIVVTDSAGVVTFTEGPDYTVVPSAGDLTELRIVSGGLISPSDTILVSYKFQSLPTLEFSTRDLRYRAALDFDWISIFHRHTRSDESLISGAGESFLTDRRDTTTGVEVKWNKGPARAAASAEKRFTRTSEFENDSLDFNQSFSYRFSPTASLSFASTEAFAEGNDRETDLYTADLSLHWRPLRNLTLRPHLQSWLRKDQGASVVRGRQSERLKRAGLDVHWHWRKIEIKVSFDRDERQGLGNDTDENRMKVTLIRRSR